VSANFYWDFFGPRAEGTARHFLRHVDEMLARDGVAGCTTGVATPRAGQWTVSCRAPAEAADALRRALRPRREEAEP